MKLIWAAQLCEALATASPEQSLLEVLRRRGRREKEVIIWGLASLAKSAQTAVQCRRAISIPHSPATWRADRTPTWQILTSHCGCFSQATPSMLLEVFQELVQHLACSACTRWCVCRSVHAYLNVFSCLSGFWQWQPLTRRNVKQLLSVDFSSTLNPLNPPRLYSDSVEKSSVR